MRFSARLWDELGRVISGAYPDPILPSDRNIVDFTFLQLVVHLVGVLFLL